MTNITVGNLCAHFVRCLILTCAHSASANANGNEKQQRKIESKKRRVNVKYRMNHGECAHFTTLERKKNIPYVCICWCAA